jgi:hypothetical protein
LDSAANFFPAAALIVLTWLPIAPLPLQLVTVFNTEYSLRHLHLLLLLLLPLISYLKYVRLPSSFLFLHQYLCDEKSII